MKKKLIYTLVLMTALYFPASSKECGKLVPCTAVIVMKGKEPVAVKPEDMVALPASPFSRLLFNL